MCGFPIGHGGELYGGSMFIPSAATDTKQGRAIHAVNERWGSTTSSQCRTGSENIGIQVCKKKYSPFEFRLRKISTGRSCTESGNSKDSNDDKWTIEVKRMFGCALHTNIRERRIREHGGERTGWESFGQWSLSKAKSLAKRYLEEQLAERARRKRRTTTTGRNVNSKAKNKKVKAKSNPVTPIRNSPSRGRPVQEERQVEESRLHCHNTRFRGKRLPCILLRKQVEEENEKQQLQEEEEMIEELEEIDEAMEEVDESSGDEVMIGPFLLFDEDSSQSLKHLCHNGSCTWKLKHKYDDIIEELLGGYANVD